MANKNKNPASRELGRELIVGLFIAVVFATLIIFTIVVSGSRLLSGGRRSEIVVHFDNVGGLRKHDTVLMRGMPVGKVKQLDLRNNGVDVIVALDDEIALRQNYQIKVMQSSLLGGMQLVISEGDGDPMTAVGNLRGEAPDNVIEDVGDLVRDVRQSLTEGGILHNLEKVVDDIAEVTARIRRGEGTIGRLLSEDSKLMDDVESAVASIRTIGERLEKGEGTLGRLLSSDDTMYQDLAATLENLHKISDRLEAGEGTLGKLLSTDDSLYNDLADTVGNLKAISTRLDAGEGTLGKLLSSDDAVYQDLAASVASVKEITTRLERGEGLLGQLLDAESPLTENLEGLLKDGREVIDDFREASPISTFSSIFFGVF